MKNTLLLILVLFVLDSQAQDSTTYVYNKYIETIGGRARLNEVKTITEISQSMMITQEEEDVTYSFYQKNKHRTELTKNKKISSCMCFDGNNNWFTMEGKQPKKYFNKFAKLNPDSTQTKSNSMFNRLVNYEENKASIRLVKPENKFENAIYYVIEYQEPNTDIKHRFYISRLTYLLDKSDLVNNPYNMVQHYENYKRVDGILMPFLDRGTMINGTQTSISEVVSYKFNEVFDPEIFKCFVK